MTLTFVEKLPETNRRIKPHSKLSVFIDNFCNSDHKVMKIEFTTEDYVSTKSCYNTWQVAARRSKRPVKVVQRNNEVYLIKII